MAAWAYVAVVVYGMNNINAFDRLWMGCVIVEHLFYPISMGVMSMMSNATLTQLVYFSGQKVNLSYLYYNNIDHRAVCLFSLLHDRVH